MWDEGRRETWNETVNRYYDFFTEHLAENNDYKVSKKERKDLEEATLSLQAMPSMRALMTAGPALKKDNVAGYNCAYLAIDRVQAFDEIMYILMCGTGVGFSVERQYINKLPEVAEDFHASDICIHVADSKIGWARALKELIALLYQGQIPSWDTSRLRAAGTPLKTFGGRSSGPEPLIDLFKFTVALFQGAAGGKLSSLEAHDLVCKIADVVVVGGVRRSALISLSNLSDTRMRDAKSGQWWEIHPQRALANNSAAYTEKPDMGVFMDEFLALYKSKSGERGFFNRQSAIAQAAKNGRRDTDHEFGTNPCSEIILRSRQFCNLSEVVIRATDSIEDIIKKVVWAATIGTWQSTLTSFRYLSSKWQHNCEEERLLGVSLTGIMDSPLTNGRGWENEDDFKKFLEMLKGIAVDTNARWAKKLGIPAATAITCVKPSGTVSQLVDSASGIHARHAPHYIRTVRGDKLDPLTQMMMVAGFPYEDDITKPDHAVVFSFPIKSPDDAVMRDDMSAVEQLHMWKIYQDHWCEHKPSVTISVREDEWMDVGAWVYANFDKMSGVSFLPHSDHVYRQAPYQDCTKEEYEQMLASMPTNVDWNELQSWETTDQTTGMGELACAAGGCEIV